MGVSQVRHHGYGVEVGPDGIKEVDTCQCGHCNAHVSVKPGTAATVYLIYDAQGHTTEEPGAFCRVCMRPICLRCHAEGHCTPFEKKLERWEARDRLRRQVTGSVTG